MLEVVFSESTKAFMKQVKSKEIGGEIVNIGFSLDIGDIAGDVDGIERKDVFKNMWNLNPEDRDGKKFFNNQRQDLEKLLSAARDGIDIRIWKSSAPFSVCGCAFVCNLLKDTDCNINVVSFPKYHSISDDAVWTSDTWDAIVPNEFYKFLQYEIKYTEIMKGIEANLWEDLKLENASLRAVVNGKLISVREDFYDYIILKNIPDEDFMMASLIGKLLGEYELGVSDYWFAYRIKNMVEEGMLEVVSDKKSSNLYDILLKKVDI